MIKKIFLCFIVIFLCTISIKAYNYSQWSDEYPSGINEILIEEEIRYKFYKEIEKNIEYLKVSDFKDKEYDLTDYYYTEWSVPTIEKPSEEENREINYSYISNTFTENDINHVYIRDMYFKDEVYFSEINLYDINLNEEIAYTLEEEYNAIYNTDIMNDNDENTYMRVDSPIRISMNLGKKYNVKDIEVEIFYKTNGLNKNTFVNMFSNYIYYGIYFKTITVNNCPDGCKFNLRYSSSYKSQLIQTIPFYVYKDKLFKTYYIEKEYLNEYMTENNDYIKDEGTKTTFYRYITDEYILMDNLGNIIYDDSYCKENFCFLNYLVKKEETSIIEEISNPKTIDNINLYLFIGCFSFIILLTLFILRLIIKKKE